MIARVILFFIAVALCGVAAQAQNINTIAGNGINAVTGDGGPAVEAACKPNGIGIDRAGNIYFADFDHDVVRKVSTSGIISTVAGTGYNGNSGSGIPATSTTMNGPVDVAVDRWQNIYISEAGSNLIKKITTDGIMHTVAGGGTTRDISTAAVATAVKLDYPVGIAVDNVGSVYFSEYKSHIISKVSPAGVITTIAGTGLYDYNGDDIPATDANLNLPQGITIDKYGNLYVAETGNSRVRKINTSGVIKTVAGTGSNDYNGDHKPATAATLKGATDVAADNEGNIYIADVNNRRIRKVDVSGMITTLAGTGIAGFSGDGGPATNAKFYVPSYIDVNSNGRIYISDNGNFRIRSIYSPVGIKSIEEPHAAVSVYPNPCNGRFTVNCTINTAMPVQLTLCNLLGEVVWRQATYTNADISVNVALPSGVYMLNVLTAQEHYSARVSVMR